MTSSFAQLGLPDKLVTALASTGITEPFPVQSAAIPDALAGRDVLGKAPTGSGKTLAFGLPMLARVNRSNRQRPQALVLAPTRELAEQIKRELAPLATSMQRSVFAIYGGVGYGPQINALRKGVDVLVATPGRLEDLMEQRHVDLQDVSIVVLDEADRMADMGFMPAMRRILDKTARNRQTLLFSATLDGDVRVLSRDYQTDPARHEAGTVETLADDVEHHFWLVDNHDRADHVAELVRQSGRSIVFTKTRHGADRLAKQLEKMGIGAVAMHGGRTQRHRDRALQVFSSGKAQALIATDVAARGIHVDGVGSVIHFDPPHDAKAYVHRSGRTARAGEGGMVISLVTRDQRKLVQRMQRDLNMDASIEAPRPGEMRGRGATIGSSPAPRRNERSNGAPRATDRPQRGRQSNGTQVRTNAYPLPTGDVKRLYVANLAWSTTQSDVERIFGEVGAVHDAVIVTDRQTGRSRGFGFVEMPTTEADAAIQRLNGSKLDGRDLMVSVARPPRSD